MKNVNPDIEYICSAYFKYDANMKKQLYAFSVETVKNFSILNYNLSLSGNKNKNTIDIKIKGIKAKDSYIPKPGPAEEELTFEELYGKHTVNIIKQDGTVNSAVFDFNVYLKKIELLEETTSSGENKKHFCSFYVAEEKFSFKN